MGNYVSSALSKTSSSPAARVILPDGEVRRIHEPTKAAELMMEIPSFFLVDAKSLKIGRKFNPLAADDDLQIKSCHVYIAFPMTRATSAANASDMARLFAAAKKQQRSRVGPKSSGEDDVKMISLSAGSKLNLEDIEEFSAAEFMHRISVSKSKKPKLETIVEESFS
ncbi:BnaA10g17360D [Brassica napus]|uniref:BnaA10g17360D protein n=1 Tax=Brassica napus TaxID=3708 RepID=A0A078HKL6_BRANA|nr:BnaA10g17360D [Brassica napus]